MDVCSSKAGFSGNVLFANKQLTLNVSLWRLYNNNIMIINRSNVDSK